MRKIKKIYISILTLGIVLSLFHPLYAGNSDRAGQAGAPELLLNPWARNTGWAGANTSSVHGTEAMFLNVAGIAFTQKTEVVLAHTGWLQGAGLSVNSFGFTQKVGQTGALGVSIMSIDAGDIGITTTDLPEGGIGTFKPQFLNLGISYAKEFSHSIYGGVTAKVISEGISNAKAQGVAFDAGIQYVTGLGKTKDNLKFGISMKNVGPPLRFAGDGLSGKMVTANNTNLTIEQRSDKFELPSLINIGASYDYKLAEFNRLSLALNFTSNSFTKDQFQGGLEYGFKTYLMIRAGYLYEKGTGLERTTGFTGPCAGATLELPLGKGGRTFGMDYSYRATQVFSGTHTMGVRLSL